LASPARRATPPLRGSWLAELVYSRAWPTRQELKMKVFSWIEGFYNSRRRHSRLDNLSSADCEKEVVHAQWTTASG
jgi:transposase InsO family protein